MTMPLSIDEFSLELSFLLISNGSLLSISSIGSKSQELCHFVHSNRTYLQYPEKMLVFLLIRNNLFRLVRLVIVSRIPNKG